MDVVKLRLSPTAVRRLKREARAAGHTLSSLSRLILTDWLKRREEERREQNRGS